MAGSRGSPHDMTADENIERDASPRSDRIGKVFIVLSQDLRQCLICGGIFTRQAASEHATVLCMPGIMHDLGRK